MGTRVGVRDLLTGLPALGDLKCGHLEIHEGDAVHGPIGTLPYQSECPAPRKSVCRKALPVRVTLILHESFRAILLEPDLTHDHRPSVAVTFRCLGCQHTRYGV